MSIWNEWWKNVCINKDDIKCYSIVKATEKGQKDTKIRWEDKCLELACETFISKWKEEVTRVNAKRGEGLNKLRTYALFKNDWCFESYLQHIDNRYKRVLMTKFRIGICPLRIETGRYECVGRSKGIKAEDRICLCCDRNEVEDEYHFLLCCPAYSHIRQPFIQSVHYSKKLFNANGEIQNVLSLFYFDKVTL